MVVPVSVGWGACVVIWMWWFGDGGCTCAVAVFEEHMRALACACMPHSLMLLTPHSVCVPTNSTSTHRHCRRSRQSSACGFVCGTCGVRSECDFRRMCARCMRARVLVRAWRTRHIIQSRVVCAHVVFPLIGFGAETRGAHAQTQIRERAHERACTATPYTRSLVLIFRMCE